MLKSKLLYAKKSAKPTSETMKIQVINIEI